MDASSETGHIPVNQDRTSHLAVLHHDLSSALTSVAGQPKLSYGTRGDKGGRASLGLQLEGVSD